MTFDFIDSGATYTVPKSCCVDQSSTECERVSFSEGVRGEDQSKVLFQEVNKQTTIHSIDSQMMLTGFLNFLGLR
jgi:hypothetical protein